MILRLLAILKRRKVRAERAEAFIAHRRAVERGDTRTMHQTRDRLTQATTDALRSELRHG